ncbi:MAG: hypothetical protein IJW40_07630 [Clostridia bacterium]|nr:hypothetical protein [Clostridia bacterium]
MRSWLLCMVEILTYTFGVMAVCAYVVEQCHRATYALLGRRAGRFFWYATALPGAPIHELGHALMCLLFCHRIEEFHLLPGRSHAACVEHSYHRKNPYAAFGNIPIALGPLFSCLAVMLGVLYLAFPNTMTTYLDTISALQDSGSISMMEAGREMWKMIRSLFTEASTPRFLRLLGAYLLVSMSLHVRLSTADLRSMAPGIPWAVLTTAVIAAVITLLGETALAATTAALQSFALLQCALFALILLITLLCLAVAALLRMIRSIWDY